jgi:hypothetical protein
MDTCYTCFEDPYGYRGVSNILIPMLCNVMSAKHVRLNVCKTCMLIWLLLVNMTCDMDQEVTMLFHVGFIACRVKASLGGTTRNHLKE